MTDHQTPDLFGAREAEDPGCDRCLERLHVWADGVARGLPGDEAEPSVAVHLRACTDCREDADGLIALAERP